ncbi:hypothetical protein DL93DRAFT_578327 [Clavulina sp. PMI_390]|nr:hypothetical protein DL93DRAFT_578327 [Clavulina sp. PMI_390]
MTSQPMSTLKKSNVQPQAKISRSRRLFRCKPRTFFRSKATMVITTISSEASIQSFKTSPWIRKKKMERISLGTKFMIRKPALKTTSCPNTAEMKRKVTKVMERVQMWRLHTKILNLLTKPSLLRCLLGSPSTDDLWENTRSLIVVSPVMERK